MLLHSSSTVHRVGLASLPRGGGPAAGCAWPLHLAHPTTSTWPACLPYLLHPLVHGTEATPPCMASRAGWDPLGQQGHMGARGSAMRWASQSPCMQHWDGTETTPPCSAPAWPCVRRRAPPASCCCLRAICRVGPAPGGARRSRLTKAREARSPHQ